MMEDFNIERPLYIDLETSIKNRDENGKPNVGNNKASPHWPDNDIVLAGWMTNALRVHTEKEFVAPALSGFTLVGHNIKFDILYLLARDPDFREGFRSGKYSIYDTQLAEYILSGQTELYPKLDYCSEKYGGVIKDDRIKEFWDNGIDTEDIPKEMLEDYLVWDVKNLATILNGQLLEISANNMGNLIKSQMEALKATIEMEHNGMKFDYTGALDHANDLIDERNTLHANCLDKMKKASNHLDNPTSAKQIGTFLFGGSVAYKEEEVLIDDDGNIVTFKSGKRKGQPKKKKVEKLEILVGQLPTSIAGKNKTGYKVDEYHLKKYLTYAEKDPFVKEYLQDLLKLRTLEKDINTYYIGYSGHVYPDGMLHGSLNHCSTATGRLSSVSPNLQNISGGD